MKDITVHKIKFSIVVPFFNEAKVISKFLDSVSKLPNQDIFELILVDNNSTDNTPKIVRGYQGKIKNLTLITETKQGIGAARKAGGKMVRGEIMITGDADIQLPKNYLEKIGDVMDENANIAGLVGTYRFHDKSRFFNFFYRGAMIFFDYVNRIIIHTFAFRGLVSAVRRDAYFKAGEFNPNISALEDLELALRVKDIGKIKYVPKIFVYSSYRRFEGRFIKQIKKRLVAYYHRAILKDKDKSDWDIVR